MEEPQSKVWPLAEYVSAWQTFWDEKISPKEPQKEELDVFQIAIDSNT